MTTTPKVLGFAQAQTATQLALRAMIVLNEHVNADRSEPPIPKRDVDRLLAEAAAFLDRAHTMMGNAVTHLDGALDDDEATEAATVASAMHQQEYDRVFDILLDHAPADDIVASYFGLD